MQKLNLEEILESTPNFDTKKLVGYVTIIGRPNTGKSTFINTLIGEKISISSDIPQTTRNKILAIYNDSESQIIFFDTPGLHIEKGDYNEQINENAKSSISEADIVLYFIDSSRKEGNEEKKITEILKQVSVPIIKVYTKSDLKPRINITENAIQISSINKAGFKELIDMIKSNLSSGPLLFPDDYYTKQDVYFRIGEIIREKILIHTREEIPHSVYIETEEIEDKENLLKIISYIYTETDSQKYIIIGKGGSLLNKIGTEAREELEKIFGRGVYLALRVKTHKNWKKDKKTLLKILKK